jgi:hypothetical protein
MFTCFDGPLKKFNSAYSMCETTDTSKISIFRNTIQVISDMQPEVHETNLLYPICQKKKKRNQSDLGPFVSQIPSSATANYMQQFFMLSGNP